MTSKDLVFYRTRLELTQKDLSRALCVSTWAVISWEAGKRNMPTCVEKLFCLLYDLPFKEPDMDNVRYDEADQPEFAFPSS